MTDYEKLGLFYLGKHYDQENQKVIDESLLMYDSKDLVTHGVCMGMTGSGKTGLCVSLLEEAAIDNIPIIAIDPKGDLVNLFLTFPGLTKEEFFPWVTEDEASQKGISRDDLAAKKAELWKNGLADWGQPPERIKLFADSAERMLYTPGSSAARPLSILKSFTRPKDMEDFEAVADRVSTLVSGLLGLLDIEADPLTSQEHILLSNIIQSEWTAGRDVPIEQLIALIQDPPMSKIGAFDVEAYYPKKERFKLATSVNNLIASPQFAVWTKGEGIDIDNLFYTKDGKPRISVLSIAHLDDKERMFFVTLLLNELVSWMRMQSGTSSLRCLLYMDEIFGYLPPVAAPPSKKLFLTLLKQARAFGLGLLLATQNPGDLDYKALSNVGTWFIGRLQAERDKEKVLEGLVTANSGADAGEISKQLAGLDKRVFMLNNTSDSEPVLFHTRWALSYLAGPIMKNRFKELIGETPESATEETGETASASAGVGVATAAAAAPVASSRPVLSPDIKQVFVPGSGAVYEPRIVGVADVLYSDSKLGISINKQQKLLTNLSTHVDWSTNMPLEFELDELEKEPRDGIAFAELDAEVSAKAVKTWETDFKQWLYNGNPLVAFTCPSLEEVSAPEEDERAFRVRISQQAREQRDSFLERIRDDYEKEIDSLTKQRARAESKAATQHAQASSHTMGTVISVGTSILGSLFGSRRGYSGIARSAQRVGTTMKERGEAAAAVKEIEAVDAKLLEIEETINKKLADYQNADTVEIVPVEINPSKTDINVREVALAWVPAGSE
ncbi:MAG: ATP-binding protein [Acidobacteriota bacterium]|nr:ATP-binding protein [Acidobacteriota bacterium]MDH3529667.1 ATP-binding protein [Acidobacteriota bacterium]